MSPLIKFFILFLLTSSMTSMRLPIHKVYSQQNQVRNSVTKASIFDFKVDKKSIEQVICIYIGLILLLFIIAFIIIFERNSSNNCYFTDQIKNNEVKELSKTNLEMNSSNTKLVIYHGIIEFEEEPVVPMINSHDQLNIEQATISFKKNILAYQLKFRILNKNMIIQSNNFDDLERYLIDFKPFRNIKEYYLGKFTVDKIVNVNDLIPKLFQRSKNIKKLILSDENLVYLRKYFERNLGTNYKQIFCKNGKIYFCLEDQKNSNEYHFSCNDLELEINYIEANDNQEITAVGKISKENIGNSEYNYYNISGFNAVNTNIKNNTDSNIDFSYDYLFFETLNKNQLVVNLNRISNSEWIIRLLHSFFLFLSSFLVFIPILLDISTFDLYRTILPCIFCFTFSLNLILFIIKWVTIRMKLSVCLFLLSLVLFFTGLALIHKDQGSFDFNN